MIRVRQVKVDCKNDNNLELIRQVSRKLKIEQEEIKKLRIVKKSIDARFKPSIYYIYEVDITIDNENKVLKRCFIFFFE